MGSDVPYPQHPTKHRWEPLYTASDFQRYAAARRGGLVPKPPPSVVMVFGSRWRRYLPRKFRGAYDPRTGVYRANPRAGVVHVDGPGAPFATIVVEELAALGVRRFVIVGLAGALPSSIPAASLVLCTKALRDEGTSHHYQRAAAFARPDPQLTHLLRTYLERSGSAFTQGPSWTTDAPYRETVPEIRRYRRAGILTVEMEAAAVFAVARRLDLRAAALFVVSDHLDESGWVPRFHDTRPALRHTLGLALAALGG